MCSHNEFITIYWKNGIIVRMCVDCKQLDIATEYPVHIDAFNRFMKDDYLEVEKKAKRAIELLNNGGRVG